MALEIPINLKYQDNLREVLQDSSKLLPVDEYNSPLFGGLQANDIQQELQAKQNLNDKTNVLNEYFGMLKEEINSVLGSFKALCGTLDETANKVGVDMNKVSASRTNPSVHSQGKDLSAYKELSTTKNTLTNIAKTGNGLISGVASNDMSGSLINGVSSLGQSAIGFAGMAGGSMAAILGPLGIGALVTAELFKGLDRTAKIYANTLPTGDKLLASFAGDGANSNSRKQNATLAMDMRNRTIPYSKNTGLSTDDFINMASSLSSYGVTDFDRAAMITRQSAMWSRYTGINNQQALGFSGLVERFGGNGANALEDAYRSARASGLEKGQFGEFLEGVQRVMEDGISKGFVKSSKDVSDNLAFLSNLSGNSPLWEGKYGAQRYQQMSNAMASNTSLSSTSSMLMYQAAKNASGSNNWLDAMEYLEKGDINKEFMGSLKDTLIGAYGENDTDSITAAVKQMFGLNWTNARDFTKMLMTGNFDEATLKKMKEDVDVNNNLDSDTNVLIDQMKNMQQTMEMGGKLIAETKWETVEKIDEKVEDMRNFITKKNPVEEKNQAYNLPLPPSAQEWQNMEDVIDFGTKEGIQYEKENNPYGIIDNEVERLVGRGRFFGSLTPEAENEWMRIASKHYDSSKGDFDNGVIEELLNSKNDEVVATVKELIEELKINTAALKEPVVVEQQAPAVPSWKNWKQLDK